MNIKCKNCSGENPIGNIFCRLCGAKLSFEDIDKDIKKSLKHKEHNKSLRVISRLIVFLFILCVFYLAYLILDPFHTVMIPLNITKNQESQIISIMSKIESGAKGSYSLTSEQMNFLASKYLSSKNKSVSAEVSEGKYFRFSYSEILFDDYHVKIEISKTAQFEPVMIKNDKGEDILSFNLTEIKLGNLPLPMFLENIFADDFKPFANNSRLIRILKKIDRININGDSVELISE